MRKALCLHSVDRSLCLDRRSGGWRRPRSCTAFVFAQHFSSISFARRQRFHSCPACDGDTLARQGLVPAPLAATEQAQCEVIWASAAECSFVEPFPRTLTLGRIAATLTAAPWPPRSVNSQARNPIDCGPRPAFLTECLCSTSSIVLSAGLPLFPGTPRALTTANNQNVAGAAAERAYDYHLPEECMLLKATSCPPTNAKPSFACACCCA